MRKNNVLLSMVFCIVYCFPTILSGVLFILGNNGTNSTFTIPAVTSAYHRPTQDFFLGLVNDTTSSQNGYSISGLFPYTTGLAASFTPLVSASSRVYQLRNRTVATASAPYPASVLQSLYISNLTVMCRPTSIRIPFLVCTAETAGPANFATGTNLSTTFRILNTVSTLYAQSAPLMDAGATPATAPQTTQGILGLATSTSHVFAAVKANGATNPNFGANAADGIAITGVQVWQDITLHYHDGATGNSLAPRAIPVSIDAATTANSFGITQTTAGDNVAGPLLDMYYDDSLNKLYVSAQMSTTNTNGSQIFGLIIINYDENGDIITPVAQCTTPTGITNNNSIVAAYRTGGQDANVVLNWLSVMHTSTGFPYLITNAGVRAYTPGADSTNQPNTVYALPLVKSGANMGQLAIGNGAEFTSANTTFATGAQLGTINGATNGAAEIAALAIGGGALPLGANDSNKIVSSLQVCGDTVYAGLSSDIVDANNAPGVYYSQALFNNYGKIVRWTQWAKAAPFQLGSNLFDGSTETMYTDAVSGGVWGLELGGENVKRTDWTITGWDNKSLIFQLNQTFPRGCFSVFDLNQSIPNFGNVGTGVDRYALFGGMDIVAFARTSYANAAATTLSPQVPQTDFTLNTNYLQTTLPDGAGPVRALGYSKGSITGGNTQGFFFAGTKNGLYVWATNGGGIGAKSADFGALNAGVFDTKTHSWQKVAGVTGEVVAIKSRGAGAGGKIYVLTSDTGTDLTVEDKVYSIAQTNTAAALTPVIIATSGTADLSTVQLFYDIEVLAQPDTPAQEQVLIATTNGLWMSSTAGGVQGATNQATALWTVITGTENSVYNMLKVPDNTPIPSVIWTSQWVNSSPETGYHNRSSLSQFCFSNDLGTYTQLPAGGFNDDGYLDLDDIRRLKTMWSDGSRRFLISIPQTSNGLTTMLSLLPYQNAPDQWNLSIEAPALAAQKLKEYSRYYWVQAIGATGSIMAGTDKGVVSLE